MEQHGITMKAMHKDRTLRYDNTSDFAADVNRFLHHEPVSAGPPSAIYRARKFVRRHRVGVLVASAFTIVLTGSILSLAGLYSELRREHSLVIETEKSNFDDLIDTIRRLDIERRPGLRPNVVRWLDFHAEQAANRLANQPVDRAEALDRIGECYLRWEEFEKARAQFERSYEIRLSLYGAGHADVADSVHNIARARFFLGELDEARREYQQALSLWDRLLARDTAAEIRRSIEARRAKTIDHLASTHARLGDVTRAETLYMQAMDIRERLFGLNSLDVAQTKNNYGTFLLAESRYLTAEELFRQALEILRQHDGSPLWEARSLQNLGEALLGQQKYDEAEVVLSRALQLKETELRSPDSLAVAKTYHALAKLHLELGDLAQADDHCRNALEIRRRRLPPGDKELEQSERLADSIEARLSDASL